MSKRSLRIKDIDVERLYTVLMEMSAEIEVFTEEFRRFRRVLKALLKALKSSTS
jgi:CRISPR/Cas system CSM-associated protein Csm2 small subunit